MNKIKLWLWYREYKYELLYAIIAVTCLWFIIASLKYLTTLLKIMSTILTTAIEDGMSQEYQLIFIGMIFWLMVKLIGMIAHWLHTAVEGFRRKEKE